MVWILFRHSFLSLQEGVWNRDFEINISPGINHHGQNDVLWKGGFFKPSPLNWTSFIRLVWNIYVVPTFSVLYTLLQNLSSLYHHLKSFSFYAKKVTWKCHWYFPSAKYFRINLFHKFWKKIDISKNVKFKSAVFRHLIEKFPHVHRYFCVHWTWVIFSKEIFFLAAYLRSR